MPSAKHPNPEAQQAEQSPPLESGFSIGSLFGVRVSVDYSLLIIFALITFNLGAGVFPRWHPAWGSALNWTVSLVAAVLFFVSILVHELAHALVGRAQGIPIRRITLFLFGGMAHMEGMPQSPKAELLMAAVGPVTSIAIGVLSLMLGSYLAGPVFDAAGAALSPDALGHELQSLGPGTTLLVWLGPINIMLGLFNLVPGFPLDGGRVLRSILWAITKDIEKATRWAAGVGRLFAWFLMIVGVSYVFSGAFGQGIWLLLIGWFLNNAARMSYEQLLTRKALENVPVARVMRTQLQRVSAELPLDRFVLDYLMASDQHAFPVEAEDGSLLGLVSADDVRKVSRDAWPEVTVGDVMTRVESLSTLPPQALAERAFETLLQRDVEQIPVLEGSHLLGMVRRRDLLKWLALQSGQRRAATA